jgi:hypothetical protein
MTFVWFIVITLFIGSVLLSIFFNSRRNGNNDE